VLQIEPTPEEGVLIRVVDRGQGVPADELPHLFTRRYRASNALGQGITGSGLGLYIVRKVIEAHGGTIRAELTATSGLAFIFSLPYTCAGR
jgi:two-component system, OmpR family, sensor histidine kinase BaeS